MVDATLIPKVWVPGELARKIRMAATAHGITCSQEIRDRLWRSFAAETSLKFEGDP